MKKRKIYIIVTSLLTGGSEKQAIWLANKFFYDGFDVRFVVLKKGDELSYLLNKEIVIRQFKLFSKKDERFLARARLVYWFLVAIKNIEIGEEITFDYESTEEELVSPFKCECHGKLIVGYNVFQRV